MTALPKSSSEQLEPELETEGMKIAAYESATETMSAYIGYLTTQILKEEKEPHPNQQKIEALREQKQAVLTEHKAITPANEKLIARARYVYAPIMKAFYANAKDVPA